MTDTPEDFYGDRDAKYYRDRRAEYDRHVKPVLQGSMKQASEPDGTHIAYNETYQKESGHHANVQPPLPPDHRLSDSDANWHMDVSHPNTTHASTGQRVSHSVNLGPDAAFVPQRVKEFLVGRHGPSGMRSLFDGTYGQQDQQ